MIWNETSNKEMIKECIGFTIMYFVLSVPTEFSSRRNYILLNNSYLTS